MIHQGDRTVKVLLVLLVVGVWGLLLRPLLTPAPVQAQAPAPAAPPFRGPVLTNVQAAGETLFVFSGSGARTEIRAYRAELKGGGSLVLHGSNPIELPR